MISRKYLPHLVALLAVALIPTLIHQYLGLEEDDGLQANAIPKRLAGYSAQSTERRRAWGEAVFGSHDWFERNYERDGRTLRLFVGRGYDQKRLYHHPEIGLSRGIDLEPETIVSLDGGMSVHLLREKDGEGAVAYVLLYDGRSIVDPVANQIRNALWQLFHPRRPMTLFYVADPYLRKSESFEESEAARLLRAAIAEFLQQKKPDESGK